MKVNINRYLNELMHNVGLGDSCAGYKGSQTGICGGYIRTWVQASLCGDEEEKLFFQRINRFLDQKTVEQLKSISKVNDDRFIDKEIIQHFGSLFFIKPEEKKLLDESKESLVKTEQTLDTLYDMQGYLDNIEVYHNPEMYGDTTNVTTPGSNDNFIFTETLNQYDIEKISAVIGSIKLESRGNIISLANLSSICSYSHEDLSKKLMELASLTSELNMKSNNKENDRKVVFSFAANGHIVGLRFDPIKRRWFLNDPNHYPPRIFSIDKTHKLIKRIRKYLHAKDTTTTFKIRAYVTGDHANIAALENNTTVITSLHTAGFNLDQKNAEGLTPLQVAIINRNNQTVLQLLALNVSTDVKDNNILQLALENQLHDDVIFTLLDKMDPIFFVSDNNLRSSLDCAIMNKRWNIVARILGELDEVKLESYAQKELMQHQADIAESFKQIVSEPQYNERLARKFLNGASALAALCDEWERSSAKNNSMFPPYSARENIFHLLTDTRDHDDNYSKNKRRKIA